MSSAQSDHIIVFFLGYLKLKEKSWSNTIKIISYAAINTWYKLSMESVTVFQSIEIGFASVQSLESDRVWAETQESDVVIKYFRFPLFIKPNKN